MNDNVVLYRCNWPWTMFSKYRWKMSLITDVGEFDVKAVSIEDAWRVLRDSVSMWADIDDLPEECPFYLEDGKKKIGVKNEV